MDVNITQTRTCVCGRDVISITGRCGLCITDASVLFWRYIDGEITLAGFMRKLAVIRKPVR